MGERLCAENAVNESCNQLFKEAKGLQTLQSNILYLSSKNQVSVSGSIPAPFCVAKPRCCCGRSVKGPFFLAARLLAPHVSLTLSQQVRAQLQKSAYICQS